MSQEGDLNEPVEDFTEPDGEAAAFSDLYKYSSRDMEFSQEKKRQLFLQKQKERRSAAVDEKRHINELFAEDAMDCETIPKPKTKIRKHTFSYKLMRSEWFTEVPDDLKDSWLIKLCPEGVRYLVVAADGITTCYLRNGRICSRFKSPLPGGNTRDALIHRFTVLDCIYNKNINVLFVYDVLAWNSMSLINVEAQMRFFWLKSKFDENPEMLKINAKQNFKFVLIDCFPAEATLLQEQLFASFAVNDANLPYEGILFYHKEGHYVFGISPLVGWLKPFMLSELLRIDVPEIHMKGKPDNYESIEQYIKGTKKKKKKAKVEGMEMEIHNTEESLVMEIMQENSDRMVDAVLN